MLSACHSVIPPELGSLAVVECRLSVRAAATASCRCLCSATSSRVRAYLLALNIDLIHTILFYLSNVSERLMVPTRNTPRYEKGKTIKKYCPALLISRIADFAQSLLRIVFYCCCCCFSHSAHWLPTRKTLLYTVANPARGLLNREKKKKKKSGSAPPPPPPPRAARSEKK